MLLAFGESEKTFAQFFEAIRIKNIKPFDIEDFATSAAARCFGLQNTKPVRPSSMHRETMDPRRKLEPSFTTRCKTILIALRTTSAMEMRFIR
jgi:hypothetical protein